MSLIANRKFLNWSGMYFVAFAAVAILSLKYDIPFNSVGLSTSPLYLIFAIPAAFIAFGVTVSALIHIVGHRRFGWLVPIIFFAYVGAYLYGFSVASNPEFAE